MTSLWRFVRWVLWITGWLAVGTTVLSLAIITCFLYVAPPARLGMVTFTLENLLGEPMTILEFSLPARQGSNNDPPTPWFLRADSRNFATLAGPLDVPPGRYVARLTWQSASSGTSVTTEIPFEPLVRRTCEVHTALAPNTVRVRPCFDQGPRPWFHFD